MSEQTNKVNLDKHINELDEYEKILKHADALLYNLGSQKQETWDKNDVYELSYIITELELLIKDNLVNSDIKTSAQAVLQKLKIIDINIPDSKLKGILSRPLKSLSKMNKAKYGKKNKYRGLRDPKEKTVKYEGSIKYYFQKRLPMLLSLSIMLLLINGGALESIIDTLVGGVSNTVTESITTDTSGDNNKEANEVLQTTLNTTKTEMNSFMKIIKLFLSPIGTIVLVIMMLTLALDILYLTVPALRASEIVNTSNFVSSEAIEALQEEHTYVVEGKIINSDDRFETSEALLHIMLNPDVHKVIKDYDRVELIVKRIDPVKIKNKLKLSTTEKMKEALEDIESRVKNIEEYGDDKDKYITKAYVQDLVHCEMLYQCLTIVETYRG